MLRLLLAILATSTGAPLARWASPAPDLAIAAMRVGFASVLLFAAGHRELGELSRALRGRASYVVAAGVLLAIHFGAWIASLSYTSTAASVSLVSTSPVFAALFASLVGDRVHRRELAGIAVAAAGAAVLAGGDWQSGGRALVGDGLALVGAAAVAGYLLVGRRLRDDLPLLPYLGMVNAIAALVLVVAAVATGIDFTALPAHSYAACAIAAVTASFIGHSLLNASVRTTPTHLVVLAVLGEPISSSLITWAAFHEQPPLHAAAGGAIVLVGIAIGFARRRG